MYPWVCLFGVLWGDLPFLALLKSSFRYHDMSLGL